MTDLGIQFFKTAAAMFGVAMIPLLIYAFSSVKTSFDLKLFILTSKTRITLLGITTTLIALLVTAIPEIAQALVSLGPTIWLVAFALGGLFVASVRGDKVSA